MPKKEFTSEVSLFFVISVLFFISITSFDPFVSSYATELGISPVLIGSIVGVTGLASMFTRLPLGILSDILLRRKLFIQVGLLLTMCSWTIAFMNPNEYTLFFGRFSNGLAGSTWVIYTVMFTSFFSQKREKAAIAIISVASPLGSFLGSTIGGIVISQFQYSSSFVVSIGAALLAVILSLFVKEKRVSREGKKYDRKIFTSLITNKTLWLLAGLGVITQMVMYGTRDSFTPLLARDLGANAIVLSWLSNAHLLLFGLATALCPLFYKYLGLKNTGLLGFALQGIIVVLLPLSPNLVTMFILQSLAGIAYGLNFTFLMSIVLENAYAQEKTTRMGFFQSMYSLGVFGGPLIMGVLIEAFSEEIAFAFLGVLSLIAFMLTKYFLFPEMVEKDNNVQREIS